MLITCQVLTVIVISMINKKIEVLWKKMPLLPLTAFSMGYLLRDLFVSILLGELATRFDNGELAKI